MIDYHPTLVQVRLTSGGAGNAPPWACLEVTSVSAVNGEDVYEVQQPTGTAGKTLLFNGPTTLVGGGGFGAANPASVARGLSGAGSGDVGPVASSWSLSSAATTKTHRVVGGASSGSYQLEKLSGGDASGDFGTAIADVAFITSGTIDASGYVKALGTAVPTSLELDALDNPNNLAGDAGDLLFVVNVPGSGWAVSAVIDVDVGKHAVARLDNDLGSGDGSADIKDSYLLVPPGGAAGVTTATNPNGEDGVEGQSVLLRQLSGGAWELVSVINLLDAIGRATLSAAMTSGNPTTVGNYRPWTADISTPPIATGAIANPFNLTGDTNDEVVVARVLGVWSVRAKLAASNSRLIPAQVKAPVAAGASRVGDDLTMVSVANVELLEGGPPAFSPFDPTQTVTAYWAGTGTIDAAAGAPIFVWLSYDGTNYFIVTADVCG